jgi:hypothetical protein
VFTNGLSYVIESRLQRIHSAISQLCCNLFVPFGEQAYGGKPPGFKKT